MHNKGLIKIFAIIFGLVCIYQLSFTFIASSVESQAEEFAAQQISEDQEDYPKLRENAAKAYLDSVASEPYFAGITYESAKEKELNKGLDLKGGINVILQISVRDLLIGLAANSEDENFIAALDSASELQNNSPKTYLELFFEEFDKKEGAKLASPNVFANKSLSEDINFDMTNDQVRPIIRRKIDESITSAFEVLRERIDKFGVTQPNIQRLGDTGRILVELPGAKEIARVQNLLQSTAQLEFWEVYKAEKFNQFIIEADQALAQSLERESTSEEDEDENVEDAAAAQGEDENQDEEDIDELLASDDDVDDEDDFSKSNPLISLIQGGGDPQGPVIAYFGIKDTATVNDYLSRPEVKSKLGQELRYAKFVWGKPAKDSEVIELFALKSNRKDEPNLSGSVIVDAQQSYDQVGRVAVNMQMDRKGARIWEQMTTKAAETRTQIAIVLDDIVYSAPGVSNPIKGGNSEITGEFSILEAQDLANVLRAGKLPAKADIVQSEIVGPSLGQEAIDSGINSFIIALLFVLVWMIFYYGKAGVYADIALAVNILFIFGVLAGLGAVLTLPGIAGIVLTIGMSVDANVLIFERIREELQKGKDQALAIKDGFSNALSSILDANITTGLTGLILLIFGTGPVKGFATTLLIGILTSLFTAIFITRLFIDGYAKNGKPLQFATAATKNFLANIQINFLGKRKIAYVISGILIILSIFSLTTNKLNLGVDFVGGRTYTVRFDQAVNAVELESQVNEALGSAEVKTYGASNQVRVTTNYKVDDESSSVESEIQEALFTSFQSYLPKGFTYEDFKVGGDNEDYGVMSSMKVGPTIADDIKRASFYAIFGSLIAVFLYILLRFRRWQFSLGAVAAVSHDVLIVLGIFSATYSFMPFSMEINQAFIAAILTVIGYSLNDTVVVFDRIREFFNEHPKWHLSKIVNYGVSGTLSRTLNTSLTTLIVLLAIFIFGGDSIRGFMFALIIGVVVGTYSSVFIATPVMYDTAAKKGIDLSDKNQKEIDEETESSIA
ncbi:protein translocase subunit SecDF [Psychroflexus planctonicus]|uniref:Multifunctional fusion protein n=1 Tax=Psychroflexus planctonicus TaxID=1526575 RepID=A0ABQ1SLQ2_9FLAO|nr:protein translocase subunit SecDF [Psychroflexus planctonicus]GGE42671.1 protein translocase subunit SecDF [Psychroflexus planctonicus]